MGYRLALDVGTASVATLAYALDANNQPSDVAYHDVWIFSEPLLPAKKGGVGEPKKAARRVARQARRQFDRKASRLRGIAYLAPLLGLRAEAVGPDPGQKIHELRGKAATERVELPDLLRVMLKLAKRRGYAGTFKTKKKKGKMKRADAPTGEADQATEPTVAKDETKDDLGKVEAGIKQLKSEMEKGGFETLGQYLLHRFQRGETLKLKNVGLYANRHLVEAEFEKIWQNQAAHHEVLKETRDETPLKDKLREAIFHQRPLKSPALMVGPCPLEPHHPRAPLAHMAAQAFRIEKQIADLRWGSSRWAVPLSEDQRNVLRELLDEKDEVSFEQAYKAFAAAGCPKPTSRWLNYDRPSRDGIKGNRTLAAFRKLGLEADWLGLPSLTQVRVMNLLANMGSPEIYDAADWHSRLAGQGKKGKKSKPIELDREVVAFIDRMVESGQFDRLSKMKFDGGRAAYSLKALKALVPLLREGKDEHAA